MFWNVVLEKEGLTDRSCEKWISVKQSQGGEKYATYNKRRKANWIGRILLNNCFIKHAIQWKKLLRIAVTGRRGRRRKQLLDDIKGTRSYGKLKQEALDSTLWRMRFGRGYGPAVRQRNIYIYIHKHRVIKKSLWNWRLQYNHYAYGNVLITLYNTRIEYEEKTKTFINPCLLGWWPRICFIVAT
jgi:hypothetical protein